MKKIFLILFFFKKFIYTFVWNKNKKNMKKTTKKKKPTDNTYLLYTKEGAGQFRVFAFRRGGNGVALGFVIIGDMTLFNDAFNCVDDTDCSFYDSIEEAQQRIIDLIFGQ